MADGATACQPGADTANASAVQITAHKPKDNITIMMSPGPRSSGTLIVGVACSERDSVAVKPC